jgi:hypothetical protein
MYFEGLPSWPAAAFSQFEIALTLASSDAAKSKEEAEKWFKPAIEADAVEGGNGEALWANKKPPANEPNGQRPDYLVIEHDKVIGRTYEQRYVPADVR